jgi:hypothetical protein
MLAFQSMLEGVRDLYRKIDELERKRRVMYR